MAIHPSKPVTPTPTLVGVVYGDSTKIELYVPGLSGESLLYLKTKDGEVIRVLYMVGERASYDVKLTPNTQYQVTAVEPLMKESEPFIFTVIARTKETE